MINRVVVIIVFLNRCTSPISRSPSILLTIETMIAMDIVLHSTGAGRQRVLKNRNGQAN
jgi:hypothetical protein